MGLMEEVKEIRLKIYIMSMAWCLKGESNTLKIQHMQ